MVGRLMFHARMVQLGKRKPLSWVLFWDLPIALGMGWLALGLAVQLGIAWEPTISIAIVAAHLGPYSVDRAFSSFLDWKFGTPAKEEGDK